MRVGDIIRDHRAAARDVSRSGHPGPALDEAQAEVDCTAHAGWMHSLDILAVARKAPGRFTGVAWDDLTQAHKHLGEAIKLIVTRDRSRE